MASGLVALLDDVAAIAKIAATSLDDVTAAASKAGSKAVSHVENLCGSWSGNGRPRSVEPRALGVKPQASVLLPI